MNHITSHGLVDQDFRVSWEDYLAGNPVCNKILFVFGTQVKTYNTPPTKSQSAQPQTWSLYDYLPLFKADSIIYIYGNLAVISQTTDFIIANRKSSVSILPFDTVLTIEKSGNTSSVSYYDYNGNCLLTFSGDPYIDEVALFINECSGLSYQSLQSA